MVGALLFKLYPVGHHLTSALVTRMTHFFSNGKREVYLILPNISGDLYLDSHFAVIRTHEFYAIEANCM